MQCEAEEKQEVLERTMARPCRSLHVHEIAASEDGQRRVASYDLKEVGRGDNYANWFISPEFAPLTAINQ